MKRDYQTLDAILIVATVAAIIAAGGALVFVKVPEANLPILSSLVSSLVTGILGLYAGARWGNKKTGDDTGASVNVPLNITATNKPPVDEGV